MAGGFSLLPFFFFNITMVVWFYRLISVKKCFPAENCLLYTSDNKSKKYFYTLADVIFERIAWNCTRYIPVTTLQLIV